MYDLIGKSVRVHLYTREGAILGSLTGRVADVARAVEVAPDMKKDLVYVVGIETGAPDIPYRNSAGGENEGWFALQDIEVVSEGGQRLFTN